LTTIGERRGQHAPPRGDRLGVGTHRLEGVAAKRPGGQVPRSPDQRFGGFDVRTVHRVSEQQVADLPGLELVEFERFAIGRASVSVSGRNRGGPRKARTGCRKKRISSSTVTTCSADRSGSGAGTKVGASRRVPRSACAPSK
jgi:hypothetical protein